MDIYLLGDFNLFAKQAQLDIFDEYFIRYNQQINEENARISGTGYADIKKGYEEVIDTFSITSFLHKKLKTFIIYLSDLQQVLIIIYLNKVLCFSGGSLKGEAEKVTHSKITMLNSSLLTSPSTSFLLIHKKQMN